MEKVGKGWLDVTRIYERSYFTRLTSCEDSLLVGSANVEGNDQGMKEDRKHEVRIRKCASRIYRVCVSGLYKIDNNFSYKNVKFNNYTVVRD